MDTLQKELEAAYPALRIQLLGVNDRGQEVGNVSTTDGRDLPWLQDVDENQNGLADVAKDLWDITFRDVVILDGDNVQVGVFNLDQHNLANQEEYETLREMLVDAALLSQLPWMNAANPRDVDANGVVVPLDVLLVVNRLNNVGSQKLPPPTAAELTPPFYDCNGDGNLTALDPLQIVNYLNNHSEPSEGESLPAADVAGQNSSEDTVRKAPQATNSAAADDLPTDSNEAAQAAASEADRTGPSADPLRPQIVDNVFANAAWGTSRGGESDAFADFLDDRFLVGKLTALQLGINQLAVDAQFEAPTAGRL
jgi:hypothetical protein